MAVLHEVKEDLHVPESGTYKRVFNAVEIAEKQRKHDEISQVRNYIQNPVGKLPVAKFAKFLSDLSINEHDILVYKNSAVVVSVTFAIEFISALHEDRAHPGNARMRDLVKESIWRPNINELVAEVTRACPVCQFYKPNTANPKPPLHFAVHSGGFRHHKAT